MSEGLPASGVVLSRVTIAREDPFCGQKPLNSHRTASMDPRSGDANLRAQTKSVSVGHSGAAVGKDAGGVNGVQEGVDGVRVLGDDDVGVGGSVAVDVVDGLVDGLDNLDGAPEVTVLVLKLGSLGATEGQLGRKGRACIDGDA